MDGLLFILIGMPILAISIVPKWLVALLAAGIVVAANLLADGPAWMASRAKPGRLLRAQ